jgi:beta-mannosidase
MTTSPEIKKFVLPLDGVWEFREFPESARRMRDLEGGSWKPAVVPSSIYTCLNESGLIDVFELRADPADFNWVSETSWVFKKSFDWPSEHCRKDHVQLVFEGLDTVTQIWLNEKLIAKTDNMFIPHTVDVTSIIKPGCNTLMVKFLPAKAESQRRMLRYGKLSEHHFGDPCRTYLRKAQYQFGSVLGPSLPGCGIFRSVRLEAIETASIKDIYIRTIDCSQHSADIRIELSITHPGKCQNRLRCRLTVSGGGLDMQHELPVDTKDNRLTTVIRIERPILWWPKGYGVQHLYHLNVQLLTEAGKCLDEAARDFGVRMIRLNRSADKLGHSFCIEVNEQPIAIRGANWMPLSILTASQSPEAYKTLLSKCANSHINMLRVWAGGYYEDPFFYQVCDRLGILVWQDFMFVSAYYPDRQWFKETVETEARSIICRLRSHACLALWCGNSRIDQLHKEGRLGSGRKFYGKSIYHNILPELLNELDPDHDYIPTTPFFEPAEKDPKADTGGTTHSWQMWTHYASVTEQMQQNPKAPRFVVEFGMQSLPELETLKTFCRPRDRSEERRVGKEC